MCINLQGHNVINKVKEFNIILNPESSSMIAAIGFEFKKDTIGVLSVVFKTNGSRYCYEDVTFDVFKEFISCDSYGSFLNNKIKGTYETSKENVK